MNVKRFIQQIYKERNPLPEKLELSGVPSTEHQIRDFTRIKDYLLAMSWSLMYSEAKNDIEAAIPHIERALTVLKAQAYDAREVPTDRK